MLSCNESHGMCQHTCDCGFDKWFPFDKLHKCLMYGNEFKHNIVVSINVLCYYLETVMTHDKDK